MEAKEKKMKILIYLIIIILFAVLLFWTWNNTKDFKETKSKIKFIIIGIITLSILTLILFNISKIGINYPNKGIMKEIRNISLLIFIPINGFFTLPHLASISSEINLGTKEEEKIKRKIIILAIVFLIVTVIETIYLKDFQNGILQMLNSK